MAAALRRTSGFLAELLITASVVMFLFVIYQLWWTNVTAHKVARSQVAELQRQWTPPTPASTGPPPQLPPYPQRVPAGERFAVIGIPSLGLTTAIAEGTDRTSVLDQGLVGHYAGEQQTAYPWEAVGNFALSGHRNSHGEPFRYIADLERGDKIFVETARDYFTYEVTGSLRQTSPANTDVIAPVPAQSGFTAPGRYITLTTCTPEFRSTYRLVVWGRLVEERSKTAVPTLRP